MTCTGRRTTLLADYDRQLRCGIKVDFRWFCSSLASDASGLCNFREGRLEDIFAEARPAVHRAAQLQTQEYRAQKIKSPGQTVVGAASDATPRLPVCTSAVELSPHRGTRRVWCYAAPDSRALFSTASEFASMMRRSGFLSPRGVLSTGLTTLAGEPAIRCPCAKSIAVTRDQFIHERLLPRDPLRAVKNMTSFHCHCVLGRPTDPLTPSFSPHAARRSVAPRPVRDGFLATTGRAPRINSIEEQSAPCRPSAMGRDPSVVDHLSSVAPIPLA